MADIKISIVIPYYNGKAFIKQAVDSVLSQPYKNIEIIIINDGSPDDGDELCKSLADKDSRVKYYEKDNEGIGATRNFGIRLAEGDYISFLDQDDVWCKNFLDSDLVDKLSQKDDIFSFSYYVTNHNFKRGKKVTVTPSTVNGGYKLVSNTWRHHSSFLFCREFILDFNIKYALTRHEDEIFLQKTLYKANSVTTIDKPMFCYRNNRKSETHSVILPEKLYIPLLRSWVEVLLWHQTNHPHDDEIIRLVKNMICIYAMEAIEAMYQRGYDDSKVINLVKNEFPNDIIKDFESIMFTEWRKELYRKYYNEHECFVSLHRKKIFRSRILKFFYKFPFVQDVYDKRKYPEIVPKELYN